MRNVHLKSFSDISISCFGRKKKCFLWSWLFSVKHYCGTLELNWSSAAWGHWCILWKRSNQISFYCRPCLSKQDTAQTPLFSPHILRDGMCWLKLKLFQQKERNKFLLYVSTAFLHLSTKNQMSALSHRDSN